MILSMGPAEELRYLILAAQREGARALAGALAPLGLTPAQAEALAVLRDANRALSVKSIGERLVCETGSPSRLMRTLVEKGLVLAQPSADDRRVTLLGLSPAGRRAARRLAAIERRLHALIAARLAPEEIEQTRMALWTLVGDLPAGLALARRQAARKRR
jgi:DNA-binding MarR family transcriptional regulator